MPSRKTQDHRSRVGAARRQQTRMLLVESAMAVFAARGAEGSVIDEVITTAGVARGTFYNYFRGNEDLLAAVAQEVSDQMLRIVDPVVRSEPDSAARVATGIRLVLGIAREHPQLAAFMVRGGPAAIGAHGLATEYLPRDLAEGIAAGRFGIEDPRIAFDLVTGAVLAGFHAMSTRKTAAGYADDLAGMILQALGVAPRTARSLAHRKIAAPAIGRDSLIARAEQRALRAFNRKRSR